MEAAAAAAEATEAVKEAEAVAAATAEIAAEGAAEASAMAAAISKAEASKSGEQSAGSHVALKDITIADVPSTALFVGGLTDRLPDGSLQVRVTGASLIEAFRPYAPDPSQVSGMRNLYWDGETAWPLFDPQLILLSPGRGRPFL